MKKQTLLIVILILAVAAAAYYGTYVNAPEPEREASAGAALIGGDFSLTDHHGQPVTNASYQGKFRLVFFGFTHCPDVCPATLGLITDVMGKLKPETAEKVVPLLITVDPERDTPQVMAEYLQQFDSRVVGLTGSPEEVKKAVDAYRVYVAKEPTEAPEKEHGDHEGVEHREGHGEHGGDHHPAPSITISHSAFIYLMDENGKYVTHFNDKEPAEGIAETLESYVK